MEKKRIWDNYKEIGEVRKSDRIKFIIAAATRDGYRYINIREFYLKKSEDIWKPGRDGITIPLKAPLNKGEEFITPFTDMYNLLKDASEYVGSMDLLDEDNAVWMEVKKREDSRA